MRILFSPRQGSQPEKLMASAEIVFDDGPLAGMKLVGFSIWKGKGDAPFVSFPSRAMQGQGSGKKFYEFLRSVGGDVKEARRVKEWILEQYREAEFGEFAA